MADAELPKGVEADNTLASMSSFDRIGRRFIEQPVWFAGAVLLALILLPVAVWLDLQSLSNVSLSRQANDLNTMISEIRGYYSRNVIGRVKANEGKATPAHNYADIDGGIPIPATLSIELGRVIGRAASVGYRFVSDETFSGRVKHNLDAFELSALQELRGSGDPEASVTDISGSLFNRRIRMAVPVIMGSACVTCHNSHPESPRNDWKVGDVRGIQTITIDQPIATNLLSFKYLLTYLFFAGVFGVAFATLQWRQAKQFVVLNTDLEEANSFLASVSMKISKYLSPQVYKSIFSGERDAIIATERKKLTIFFSDIKDFTSTTERLQPEELTALLNEYFTEMATIALEHGATVDKFIGDAILAFFGDPETLGTKEDALACVKMAIAMQNRLEIMGEVWRRRGLEKPFRARMGINTGYCNVGNFGSDDRMDYTIIGAEANLAARLESIAEPGGIVMSFETYSLVQDFVKSRPMEPIRLKGISREVVPYVIENIHQPTDPDNQGVIEANSDRLRLFLDTRKMPAAEREEVEAKLVSALDAVRQSRD